MSSPYAHLLPFLPEPLVGTVEGIEPISLGLSGAGVWAVTTGLLSGLTFLGLVEDLNVRPAPRREDAPTLLECYEGLRSGQLELQSPRGQASMGLALLALGVAPQPG